MKRDRRPKKDRNRSAILLISALISIALGLVASHPSPETKELSLRTQPAKDLKAEDAHSPEAKQGIGPQASETLESLLPKLSALLNLGKIDEVLSSLIDLYETGKDPRVAVEIGMLYWHEKRDLAFAKQWLHHAVRNDSFAKDALQELVHLHQETGSIESELLPFLNELTPSSAVDIAKANGLIQVGRNQEARSLLERHTLQLEPQNLFQLATLRSSEGDIQGMDHLMIQAWEKFKKTSHEQLISEDQIYRAQALASYERMGEKDKAREVLQDILLSNPDKVEKLADYIERLRDSP